MLIGRTKKEKGDKVIWIRVGERDGEREEGKERRCSDREGRRENSVLIGRLRGRREAKLSESEEVEEEQKWS